MKSIGLTDTQYAQIVKAAKACGYFVGRGKKSRLSAFVTAACRLMANVPPIANESIATHPAHEPTTAG